MTYLYHGVPNELIGSRLYPLNELKTRHPKTYAKEYTKYLGREEIMQQPIPRLNCLWNDVLHFSAVHPSAIQSALNEAGNRSDFKKTCYEIDPALLEEKNTIVYLYLYKDRNMEENWTEYNAKNLEAYSLIPQFTKDYYKQVLAKNARPLLYHGIPHILYKGSLDVTNLRIVRA